MTCLLRTVELNYVRGKLYHHVLRVFNVLSKRTQNVDWRVEGRWQFRAESDILSKNLKGEALSPRQTDEESVLRHPGF